MASDSNSIRDSGYNTFQGTQYSHSIDDGFTQAASACNGDKIAEHNNEVPSTEHAPQLEVAVSPQTSRSAENTEMWADVPEGPQRDETGTIIPVPTEKDDIMSIEDSAGGREKVTDLDEQQGSLSNPIDFTMDEDVDNNDGTLYNDDQTPRLDIAIKLEPDDEEFPQNTVDEFNTYEDSLHDSPEWGPKTIPKETDFVPGLKEEGFGEITADDMALMLEQFNKNNAVETSILPDEVDSDEEDIRAMNAFAILRQKYEQRRLSQSVSHEEIIEFEMAAKKEMMRRKARQNRIQHEKDVAERERLSSPLFVPESRDSANDNETNEGFAASSNTRLRSNSSPGQQDAESDAEASRKTPRRGRPNGSKSKPAAKKTAGKSKVTKGGKDAAAKKGAKRGRKKDQVAIINTNSLLHHDIIAEANANQGQAAQPGFTSKNRKNALTELVASLPQDQRDLYKGDKVRLDKAAKNFNGRGAMKSDGNGNWILRGMKSSLKHYQMIGVSWMREREMETKNPRGGILSDDMGLGKTISCLANMVDGIPASNHHGPRATLVVAPSGLLNQWFEETEKHVDCFRNVMIYQSKMKALDMKTLLSQQDVVITSYHEVMRSLPPSTPPPNIGSAEAKAAWWSDQLKNNTGLLHQIVWHRIVLDEAQAIKNHLSRTSAAACYLKGRYRWCVSGTPIQNATEEFYPYFRFLKCDNTGSFELFKRNFAKPNSEKAMQRLQLFLGKIMLRRTHADKLFGLPIIQLPPIKPVETIEVRFNPVERAIYTIVKRRFVEKIKTLSQKDSLDKSYQTMFVLLLRLRQLVGHTLLIQKTLKDLLEIEDIERLWLLTKEGPSPTVIGDDGNDGNSSNEGNDGSSETVDALRMALSMTRKPGAFLGFDGVATSKSAVSKTCVDFQKYLQSLRDDGNWAAINSRSFCVSCRSPPTKPYITSCQHVYCYACLDDIFYQAHQQQQDCINCEECQTKLTWNDTHAAIAYNEAGQRQNMLTGRLTPEEDIDWYRVEGPILRSAKIKAAVAQIKKWFEQDADSKILVFTQFRGIIKVMERVCQEEDDWGYATYHGAMSFDARDEQVRMFTQKPECKILLAALKAGGVGLNLTAANRVIILDLWWNSSVESQAFCRCFRIGQKRDVEVVRFVVFNSIDTDIIAMQERKNAEIEQAMDDRHRPQKLTTAELLELFSDGSDRKDKDGNMLEKLLFTGEDEPFIMPDDQEHANDEEDDVEMTG